MRREARAQAAEPERGFCPEQREALGAAHRSRSDEPLKRAKNGPLVTPCTGVRFFAISRSVAVLAHAITGRRVELAADTLVGRSRACGLLVERPLVSSLHARFRWGSQGWTVQDLSRNGTWVNARQIGREGGARLTQGDSVCFGHPDERWDLVSSEAPRPAVVPCDGGPALTLSSSPLALPSELDPVATLWLDGDGFVVLETAERRAALVDSQVFSVNAQAFRVQAPHLIPPTAEAAPALSQATLQLGVSRHEEHISARLVAAGHVYPLRSRGHFELLVALGRERLRDQARGLGEAHQGWLPIGELCRMLKADRATINTHVYRLRKQFGALQIRDASEIVERRFDSDEIRLGCPRVEVSEA